MVLYGVVPECHRSVSGMVSECIMSAKMVSLSASGTVYSLRERLRTHIVSTNLRPVFFTLIIISFP